MRQYGSSTVTPFPCLNKCFYNWEGIKLALTREVVSAAGSYHGDF